MTESLTPILIPGVAGSKPTPLDRETLKSYNPEESDKDIKFTAGSFRVILFDSIVPPNRPWKVSIVLEAEEGKTYQDILEPQGGRSRADFISGSINARIYRAEDIEEVKLLLHKFFSVLVHSYNRAKLGVTEETLEIFDGNQSLDLETWPMEAERELVAGFAVRRGYTHLFGDAGVGKSILAHNIGLHAASGSPYLGFGVLEKHLPPVKVLYLSLEMYYDEFRERHNKLLASFPEIARESFMFICPESFDVTTERDRSLLGNTVTKHGIELVIVDSHTDWRGAVDLNDNGAVGAQIILPYRTMMKQLDFGSLLLDHTGWKGERPSGAKVVWNKASIGIFMEGEGENLTKISFKKWRSTARKRPRPVSLKYDPETYLIDRQTEADLLKVLTSLRLPAMPGEVTKQIMELMNLQERQANAKKAELVRGGYLIREGRMLRAPEPRDTGD